jgi:hypothetical protein
VESPLTLRKLDRRDARGGETKNASTEGRRQMSDKNVTVIPAKPIGFTQGLPGLLTKRRVAGYARVSTDKDEQQNSYEAQVDYYTDYIKRNPEWEFVEVYTDEYTPYGLNPKSP